MIKFIKASATLYTKYCWPINMFHKLIHCEIGRYQMWCCADWDETPRLYLRFIEISSFHKTLCFNEFKMSKLTKDAFLHHLMIVRRGKRATARASSRMSKLEGIDIIQMSSICKRIVSMLSIHQNKLKGIICN